MTYTSLHPNYDNRWYLLKIYHLFISLFRQALYSLTFFYYRLFSNIHEYSKNITWKKDSEGLICLFHGLRSDPATWYKQIALIKKQNNKIDIFAPKINKKGLCPLEDASTPILPTLLDFANKYPKKPICLIGVSNGSRIAMWLENKLRTLSNQTPVKVSTIAGVHFGSSRMNLLEKLKLAKLFYPEVLIEELKYGSKTSEELLNQVRKPLPKNCVRSYEFFASTEDSQVPELDSSLPILDKGEEHHVIHGETHNSIVSAVAKKQISSCLSWIASIT
jgi:hypothetical protein